MHSTRYNQHPCNSFVEGQVLVQYSPDATRDNLKGGERRGERGREKGGEGEREGGRGGEREERERGKDDKRKVKQWTM